MYQKISDTLTILRRVVNGVNNLLYARLAKTNLSKNRQNILPYLLSCIGTVVMFFIMDTLAQGSGFDSMIGKDTILTVMGMGTYIIGLFAVIFLIYSNSFLAKRRKKEFGSVPDSRHGEKASGEDPLF